MIRRALLGLVAAMATLGIAVAATDDHGVAAHPGHVPNAASSRQADTPATHAHTPPMAADTRVAVEFPEPLRTHTLANMRDHLQTLAALQAYVAEGRLDEASELAETRLGMSSLPLHGAADVAPYMPRGMQEAGTAMHRSASAFAIAARDAGATGDTKPVLSALAAMTGTCVACHAAYRLR